MLRCNALLGEAHGTGIACDRVSSPTFEGNDMGIKIRSHRDGWFADFEHDEEVFRLFGSTILPTPFTLATPIERVLVEVQRLNPSAIVSLGSPL
jgi:hypothetical protein